MPAPPPCRRRLSRRRSRERQSSLSVVGAGRCHGPLRCRDARRKVADRVEAVCDDIYSCRRPARSGARTRGRNGPAGTRGRHRLHATGHPPGFPSTRQPRRQQRVLRLRRLRCRRPSLAVLAQGPRGQSGDGTLGGSGRWRRGPRSRARRRRHALDVRSGDGSNATSPLPVLVSRPLRLDRVCGGQGLVPPRVASSVRLPRGSRASVRHHGGIPMATRTTGHAASPSSTCGVSAQLPKGRFETSPSGSRDAPRPRSSARVSCVPPRPEGQRLTPWRTVRLPHALRQRFPTGRMPRC